MQPTPAVAAMRSAWGVWYIRLLLLLTVLSRETQGVHHLRMHRHHHLKLESSSHSSTPVNLELLSLLETASSEPAEQALALDVEAAQRGAETARDLKQSNQETFNHAVNDFLVGIKDMAQSTSQLSENLFGDRDDSATAVNNVQQQLADVNNLQKRVDSSHDEFEEVR